MQNKEMRIKLNMPDEIKLFVREAQNIDSDIIINKRIDGKSLMGIMTLDLSRQLDMLIICRDDDIERIEKFISIIDDYGIVVR